MAKRPDNPPTFEHGELVSALSQFAQYHKRVVRGLEGQQREEIEIFGNPKEAQRACEEGEKVATLWLIHNDNLWESKPIKFVCKSGDDFN